MTITLGGGTEVEVEPPVVPVIKVTPPTQTVTVEPPTIPAAVVAAPQVPVVRQGPPVGGDVIALPVVGPPGPPGAAGGGVFTFVMPVAQTTALIEHGLGRDPVAVQVLLDGAQIEEYSVTFPIPGQTVLVGFDISIQAKIRLL